MRGKGKAAEGGAPTTAIPSGHVQRTTPDRKCQWWWPSELRVNMLDGYLVHHGNRGGHVVHSWCSDTGQLALLVATLQKKAPRVWAIGAPEPFEVVDVKVPREGFLTDVDVMFTQAHIRCFYCSKVVLCDVSISAQPGITVDFSIPF